jgi:hypothetical protein
MWQTLSRLHEKSLPAATSLIKHHHAAGCSEYRQFGRYQGVDLPALTVTQPSKDPAGIGHHASIWRFGIGSRQAGTG